MGSKKLQALTRMDTAGLGLQRTVSDHLEPSISTHFHGMTAVLQVLEVNIDLGAVGVA